MREPIKDRTRLLHILEGINNILEFKEGIDYDNFSACLYIYIRKKKTPASRSFDLNLRELSHTLRTKLNAHSSYPIKQHLDSPVQ